MKFIEKIIAWVSWIQIFLLPSVIGFATGFTTYKFLDSNYLGIILGLTILIIGLTLGFYWAEKIRRKQGTLNFMSKVNASPDVP